MSRMEKLMKNLDLSNKQSIVDLLFEVQAGNVSCRRMADEIMRVDRSRKLLNMIKTVHNIVKALKPSNTYGIVADIKDRAEAIMNVKKQKGK